MKTHFNHIYDDACLIRKSLMQDSCPSEERRVDELLEDEKMLALYEELADSDVLRAGFEEMNRFSSEQGYAHFCRQRKAQRRRKLFRVGAAVAAVCVMALGSLWWVHQPQVMTDLPVAAVQQMTPGERQAKLILANGREVDVTRGGDGKIVEQEAEISYKDGELVYNRKQKSDKLSFNMLQVPRGGECGITLVDGTKVWVNAESCLRYPVAFGQDRREVVLEGEAYFEVKRDEQRPFIVKTSYGEVKVLGTSFGVSAYVKDEVSYTTLVSGKVQVEKEKQQPVVISPGEQVLAFKSGKLQKRQVDISEYVGWKDGLYVFNRQRLDQIMTTLERWYNITVKFESEELKGILYTGSLNRYDDVNVFFEALKSAGDVKYRVAGKEVTLHK